MRFRFDTTVRYLILLAALAIGSHTIYNNWHMVSSRFNEYMNWLPVPQPNMPQKK